jgi:hypothetical protein
MPIVVMRKLSRLAFTTTGVARVCLRRPLSKLANLLTSTTAQKTSSQRGVMKSRVSRILKFWIDVECSREAPRYPGLSKKKLIAMVVFEFEQAGDAMRYLRSDGKIGWKATPRMLDRLADAERDAIDDLAHHDP